ncbi:hypothetical protein F5882DRAFT_124139 [Hyaloscypha sp. PMI_1271]|nr:hypothetical protein F5882DRAFT_124139 [Hyaloscypha sp. PMI_1271]
MDLNPEPARKRQTEQLENGFSNVPSTVFHHSGPYAVALPVFIVTFPYTMHPNAAVQQLMHSGFRASFPGGIREDVSGNGVLGAASGQFQDVQLNVNSDFHAGTAAQVETAPVYATPEPQVWPYETGAAYSTTDDPDLPSQDSNATHTFPETHLLNRSPMQQEWHSESAAHDDVQRAVDFPTQAGTAYNPFLSDYDQDNANSMLGVDNANGGIDFSGTFSAATSSTAMDSSVNNSTDNFYQPPNTPYDTSTPSQELSPPPTLSAETSFSSTASSPLNFTPSPTNASSPTSTSPRHPCPHPHCPKSFARPGDLTRHAKIHSPERHRKFNCWQPDCNRNGQNAFTRRDKWKEHLRNVHKLEEGDRWTLKSEGGIWEGIGEMG